MKIATLFLMIAAGATAAAGAAPKRHVVHHKITAQDPVVQAAVAHARNLEAATADNEAQVQAMLNGDTVGAAAAQGRSEARVCQDHDIYMENFERASPDERVLLHERCYGSRSK